MWVSPQRHMEGPHPTEHRQALSPQSLWAPRTTVLSVHLVHHVHLPLRVLANAVPLSWDTVPQVLSSQWKHMFLITLTR